MGTITPINPQVVYTQATEPTDKTEGKLWYNTTNNSLYTSNGTNYILLENDVTYLDKQQLEQDINILINSVASSSTLNDYDDMFIDIFNTANGYDGTIDTSNTTAIFDNNNYINESEGTTVTEGTSQELTISSSTTCKRGIRIEVNKDCKLKKVTKNTNTTSTIVELLDDDNNQLATANFIGDEATFNYNLTAGEKYRIISYSSGSTYTSYVKNSGVTLPVNHTNINIIDGVNNTNTYNYILYNINSIDVSPMIASNKIIQTNSQTITENPTAHQFYSKNTILENGNITYDISFDGGTTWITNQPINTKNTNVNSGNSMIIKINLNGTDENDFVTSYNYGVMLYY